MTRGATRRASGATRRAERLLRAYPPGWRSRYGDEFLALLEADLAERPRSWARTADVLAGAATARLTALGVAGRLPDPRAQARASLAAVGAAGAAFLLVGAALWSQVAVGWRWEPPAGPAVAAAMALMSLAAPVLVVLGGLAAAPIVWALGRALRRGRRDLIGPAVLALSGATVLGAGSRHFAGQWPGTGGHPWAYHAAVPAGVAAFVWAATRGITSYWAHPGALASFPPLELAWMAVSGPAVACLVVGAVRLARRVELSPAVWRYEAALARAGRLALLAFLAGAALWVVADLPPGPTGIYRVGAIDVVGLAVMAGAVVVAHRAARRLGAGAAAIAAQP